MKLTPAQRRERIRQLGLKLVEQPVASRTSNFARHSQTRLAQAIMEIYRDYVLGKNDDIKEE